MSSLFPSPVSSNKRGGLSSELSSPAAKNADADAPAKKRSKLEANAIAEAHSHEYRRPSDWPAATGAIDLAVQDLPHDSADTEWWYTNGHVKADDGREYSFFASFFRIVKEVRSGGNTHAHALNWAIIDCANKQYYADPILDAGTPEILRKQLESGSYDIDKRMSRAFLEIVKRNRVPLPDRVFEGPVTVDKQKLELHFAENYFYKDNDDNYHVHCEHPDARRPFSLTLKLKPLKPAQRQGHEGVVKIGLKQDTMFYYFIPRNQCEGVMQVGVDSKTGKRNAEFHVRGSAWYDHEFGGEIKVRDGSDESIVRISSGEEQNGKDHAMGQEEKLEALNDDLREKEQKEANGKDGKKKKENYAWNWVSLQLDDGTDITSTLLVEPTTGEVFDNFALIIDPVGGRVEYPTSELTPLNSWVSIRTTCEYATKWRLLIADADTDLTMEAEFDNQELITLISKPAFWEGRMNVTGKLHGKPITGKGFIERHGFTSMKSLDSFFKRISQQVLKQVELVLPSHPTVNETKLLMASDEFSHLMDGVNVDVFRDTIITPLREIVDRGGKSWRSFAFLLCIDCVGGDSTPYKHWLAMPEIMHVGSLIIDDIQDKSDIRRGGPSCHLIHGEPLAINCGTAGYFISLHVLQELTPSLTPELRLRIYELYFLTLRAGHAGQAFDIHGLDYMMDQAVKSGDSDTLMKAVACTHRLKSAVPAGCLARMGAAVGGGTNDQVEKLGGYMESIGLAFQIIDDVLNLRGFRDTTKTKGEDITAGKVTFPVAMAMSRLPLEQRQKLWETLKSKPEDRATIDATIELLEKCGAIEASVEHSEKIVKDAWNALDTCIPDSFFKMLLRAFGWYVLERHY